MEQSTSAKKRYGALDSLRGLTLISMILYHAMWDLVYLFDVSAPWYESKGAMIWQQSICWTFILLSGFCHSMGRNPLRRGLIVFSASLLITLVTLILMPDERIVFGVLTLIGVSMLLTIPVGKLCGRIPPWLGFFASFLLFLLMKTVSSRRLVVLGTVIARLPDALYANTATAFFGFPSYDFYSTDYFPLLPWYFLYLTGFFLYRIAKKHDLFRFLYRPSIPVLSFMGKHSLPIYMIHQPLIYVLLTAASMVGIL
ncbi:MAG: DUF1624 domain-containing protein [Clostridia bacterium]|nr:DUF1624 domain-containing protein [Clostridia bacterium]